ncbi:hypothetical protein D9758_009652 [Tetrapyrgos nigripes]|uniref:Uncharacterized protein n=1 Tax=Tetrapyrgos nigripes TaxID=182062 RepID=A0A8H5FPV3_9AGAR|nr:hypothetical protein D9758_009652 [Tetrapyrgos nigripes]
MPAKSSTASTSSQTETSSTKTSNGSENIQQDAGPSTSPTPVPIPKAKLFALSRFKSTMSSNFRSRSSDKTSFPRSSWDLANFKAPDAGSGASEWSHDVEEYKRELEKWKKDMKAPVSTAEVQTELAGSASASTSAVDGQGSSSTIAKGKRKASTSGDDNAGEALADDAPEPQTLAMKIKSLIDEKFLFGPSTPTRRSSQSQSAPPSPNPSSSAPSNGSVFSDIDGKLAQYLSSDAIMNGAVGKGIERGRESVWAMLDKMGYGGKNKGKATDQEAEPEEGGIMICTPLQPEGNMDLPEIAESDIVSEYRSTSSRSRKVVSSVSTQTDEQATTSSSTSTSTPVESAQTPTSPPKGTRVFYPSATKISIEVTWWGYRLYLPPPVMAQLSNAHVAAAKRGAMLTAALKWVLDQVPMMMVPPQFQAGMLMLRRVSPFLGYVGAFIVWSWDKVQTTDTGNGVVLTATWLLPIAILPAAWDFEVHGAPKEVGSGEEEVRADELSASTVKVDMAVQTESPPPVKREGSKLGSLFPSKTKRSKSSQSGSKLKQVHPRG